MEVYNMKLALFSNLFATTKIWHKQPSYLNYQSLHFLTSNNMVSGILIISMIFNVYKTYQLEKPHHK